MHTHAPVFLFVRAYEHHGCVLCHCGCALLSVLGAR